MPALPRSAARRGRLRVPARSLSSDGHMTVSRKGVWALSITCCDGWPGLMAQARLAISAVMPFSKVFAVARTGCTEIKSTSKHWLCLFPSMGRPKHQRTIELEPWQADRGGSIPAIGARPFTPTAVRVADRRRRFDGMSIRVSLLEPVGGYSPALWSGAGSAGSGVAVFKPTTISWPGTRPWPAGRVRRPRTEPHPPYPWAAAMTASLTSRPSCSAARRVQHPLVVLGMT